MKPTIGRIVLYHCTEEEQKSLNNHHTVAPAIITAVWSETTVNLKVLTDGNFNLWKTSVSLGDNSYNWNWPVIEK
jgi:hypothetical protein